MTAVNRASSTSGPTSVASDCPAAGKETPCPQPFSTCPRSVSRGRRCMAPELADVARSVIDANSYMALGTADGAGSPWVSPVWFASEDYRNFHWVSSPDAKHSRNLAAHPEVAIAIFDSSVPVGGAQAGYMKGVAKEL